MNIKAHAISSLKLSRQLTKNMLADFNTLNDWFYQPHENSNHALWIAGHLGLADNAFASKFRPKVGKEVDGWKDVFWLGSQPTSNPKDYPPIDEVLDYFEDRREVLLNVLNEVSLDELMKPAPPEGSGSPIAGAPNIAQVFFFIASHESVHCGQLSVCRRGLGHSPLIQP